MTFDASHALRFINRARAATGLPALTELPFTGAVRVDERACLLARALQAEVGGSADPRFRDHFVVRLGDQALARAVASRTGQPCNDRAEVLLPEPLARLAVAFDRGQVERRDARYVAPRPAVLRRPRDRRLSGRRRCWRLIGRSLDQGRAPILTVRGLVACGLSRPASRPLRLLLHDLLPYRRRRRRSPRRHSRRRLRSAGGAAYRTSAGLTLARARSRPNHAARPPPSFAARRPVTRSSGSTDVHRPRDRALGLSRPASSGHAAASARSSAACGGPRATADGGSEARTAYRTSAGSCSPAPGAARTTAAVVAVSPVSGPALLRSSAVRCHRSCRPGDRPT